MKSIFRFAFLALMATTLSGCFRDLGNYDYKDINEAVIGDRGFETAYNVRANSDILKIEPEITFTADPEGTGDYSYEWVAVGQNMLKGERFTISNDRNLDWKVDLAAEQYILYFKVKDNSTDIVFSKDVEMNVMSLYTSGWLLGGEDENGKGQVDMISFSSETLYPKSILKMEEGLELSPVSLVWIDNDQYTSENRLYAATPEGTYKFDRENMNGTPYTSLQYSFAVAPESGKYIMTDSQKVSDKRHVIIVDGRAYIVSSDSGMIENTFSSYDLMNEFNTAPKMICNHTDVQGIRTFIFYDLDERRFCYITGLTVKNMLKLEDGEDDAWSWKTKEDFDGGLEFVTAINSFFSSGQSAAILKNASGDEYYIYCITAPRTGTPVKNGRYRVDLGTATGFSDAVGHIMTTNHGYMIYASGNSLYGLDFRKSQQTCTVLHTFDAPVTCIYADYSTSEKYSDVFYAATYNDAEPRSGIVYKFQVEDNPDRMAIEEKEKWDEGFLKIRSMYYKNF